MTPTSQALSCFLVCFLPQGLLPGPLSPGGELSSQTQLEHSRQLTLIKLWINKYSRSDNFFSWNIVMKHIGIWYHFSWLLVFPFTSRHLFLMIVKQDDDYDKSFCMFHSFQGNWYTQYIQVSPFSFRDKGWFLLLFLKREINCHKFKNAHFIDSCKVDQCHLNY